MNMASVAPEFEEDTKSLADYLSIVKRRKKPMQITAGIVFVLALLAALFWPPTYRATATILIEEQEIPQDLVRSTITGFANQQIKVISQRVLTLNTILDIAQKYGLWSEEEMRRMPKTEIVEKFQKRMKLDVVSAEVMDPRFGRPMEATIAFTLAFNHRNPAIAQKVTNELVNLYMNENLKNRTEKTATTSQFLKGEADELHKHMTEIEEKISAFKQANEGALPELYQYNLNVIERVDMELNESKSRLLELQKHKLELQANMAQISPYSATELPNGERALSDNDRLKALKSDYRNKSALYSADHPDVMRLKREIDHLEQLLGTSTNEKDDMAQLRTETEKLDQLKQTYTATHPELLKQQRVVDALKKASATHATTREIHADSPAYVLLETQLRSTEAEIISLNTRIADLGEKVTRFEGYLAKAPNVEKSYTELVRDLQTTNAKFQEIKAKQMEAELSQNLEAERKGERYMLIEPPILPEQPVSPNRVAIILIGIILAGVGAATAAAVGEMLDESVKGTGELINLIGGTPLATIPYIAIAEEQKAVSRGSQLSIAGIFVALTLALLAIHIFYKPLDVLWFVLLRKLGFGY